MFQKLFKDHNGAATAEFALSLLVLMPLLLWMLRFGELLNLNHSSIEASRLAVWERAYGRDEASISTMVEQTVKNRARFSNNPNISVTTKFSSESSKNDFKIVSKSRVPHQLGLEYENYHKVNVTVSGQLPFGVDYSLTKRHMLLVDPWNLTDQNGDQIITSEKDLEPVIHKLWFFAINGFVSNFGGGGLDAFRKAQKTFNRWTGGSWDIEPRGHPTLEPVPKQSGN